MKRYFALNYLAIEKMSEGDWGDGEDNFLQLDFHESKDYFSSV